MFVHAEGLSFKKTLLAEEQTRPDVARKRARLKAHQGRVARATPRMLRTVYPTGAHWLNGAYRTLPSHLSDRGP